MSEQSKPAQSPIFNVRANSLAFYRTECEIGVYAAGYVDDIEHYGKAINDLAIIMDELGMGSIVTGIGFAWAKFIAFAFDWDENDPLRNPSVFPDGIQVCWMGYM